MFGTHSRWAIAVLTAALLLAAALPATAGERITAEQVIPVDGATIKLVSGERVRLVGYDTPEVDGYCPKETDLAVKAMVRLVQLVDMAETLELKRTGRDRHGRTLAVLLVDGSDVAGIMVREGLGRPYTGGPRHWWCS